MSVLEAETVVDAAPEAVWNVISDPHNLPMWDRRVAGVRDVPPAGLRKGSAYKVELKFMGVKASVLAKVLEYDPPSSSKVRLTGIMDATIETWVEPEGADRSRLRHRIDYGFRGGPLGSFAAQAVRMLGANALLRRGIEAQKRQAEAAAKRRTTA